jgi:hypothetical protein
MQVWRLLYTNLVGPRGEKLESTRPFWSFFLFKSKWEVHMSFPRELCSCRGCTKEDSMDTIHLRGCNKGGSSVQPSNNEPKLGALSVSRKISPGPQWGPSLYTSRAGFQSLYPSHSPSMPRLATVAGYQDSYSGREFKPGEPGPELHADQ